MFEFGMIGIFSLFSLWPVYYAVIALVILRNKINNKMHFFCFAILSCYGFEVFVMGLGRHLLKETWIDNAMILIILTWILATLLIYWLSKTYESKIIKETNESS